MSPDPRTKPLRDRLAEVADALGVERDRARRIEDASGDREHQARWRGIREGIELALTPVRKLLEDGP